MSKLELLTNKFMLDANIGSQEAAAQVVARIPDTLIKTLPVNQLIMIAKAIHQAHKDGKASAGAEVLHDDPKNGAVWVGCLGQSIVWQTDEIGTSCQFGD